MKFSAVNLGGKYIEKFIRLNRTKKETNISAEK